MLGTFEDSKTLAKLANKAAKKKSHLNGVCVWDTVTFEDRESLLARLPVVEIWGVGSRLTRRLNAIGIWSMMDLRDADAVMIRNRFLVLLMRTVFELRGIPCTAAQSPPAGTGVDHLGHDEPFQRQLVTQPSRFGGAAGEPTSDPLLLTRASKELLPRILDGVKYARAGVVVTDLWPVGAQATFDPLSTSMRLRKLVR